MRALEKDEGQLGPGRRRKHHRLDRFLLQYYIRQFGTKSLARKKLRQFVSSVRCKSEKTCIPVSDSLEPVSFFGGGPKAAPRGASYKKKTLQIR